MIFHKVNVPGPLLGRDDLWFDFCKRPPSVSDHSVFAFWVVAYGGFDCITRNHNKNKLKTVTYLYLYLEPILTNALLEFDGLGK